MPTLKMPLAGWSFKHVTTHPGEMLKVEFMTPLGLSQNALAHKIAVPVTRIGEIVNGRRAVTPETALRLGRFFGNSAEFWLNLQALHDLSKAKMEHGAEIEKTVQAMAIATK